MHHKIEKTPIFSKFITKNIYQACAKRKLNKLNYFDFNTGIYKCTLFFILQGFAMMIVLTVTVTSIYETIVHIVDLVVEVQQKRKEKPCSISYVEFALKKGREGRKSLSNHRHQINPN